MTFISMENLIFEIGPIILWFWFTINSYDNPFKYFVSFRFTIIDFYFSKSFGINFGSNLNSFLPFGKIFFLIELNLFFILTFFVTIFNISLINTNFIFQFSNLVFQFRDCVWTILFVWFEFIKNWIYSLSKIFNLARFCFNGVDISVDELLC